MKFECRSACGACCIEPSITTCFYGMPDGKPAGVSCVHLDAQYMCKIFGKPERPSFCSTLPPSLEMCGINREEAMTLLASLEQQTKP